MFLEANLKSKGKTNNSIKLSNIFLYFISAYFIIISIYYVYKCIKVGQSIPNIIILFCISVAFVLFMIKAHFRHTNIIPNYIKIILIFLLCFIPKYIFIVNNLYTPISDFGYYYYSALRFSRRDVFEAGPYMLIVAPNTLAFVSYLGIVLKLFGEGIVIPIVLNLIYSSLSAVLIYIIAKKCMQESLAFFTSLIFALSPSMFFYSVNIAIEPLPLFLSLLSIVIYLISSECKNSIKKYIYCMLCGVITGIAYIIRANSISFFIGILVCEMIRNKNNFTSKLKSLLALIIPFIFVYALYKIYQNTIFKIDMPPAIGWALFEGLDIKTYGTWSAENRSVLFELIDTMPPNQVQPALLKLAIERISSYNATQLFDLFLGKGINTWIINSYPSIILYYDGISKQIQTISPYLLSILQVPYVVIFVSYIISNTLIIYTGQKVKYNNYSNIFLVSIVFTILVHSIMTSIDRYHYIIMPVILVLLNYNISILRNQTNKVQNSLEK